MAVSMLRLAGKCIRENLTTKNTYRSDLQFLCYTPGGRAELFAFAFE